MASAVNINGTWRRGNEFSNIGGTWRSGSTTYSNINGVWRSNNDLRLVAVPNNADATVFIGADGTLNANAMVAGDYIKAYRVNFNIVSSSSITLPANISIEFLNAPPGDYNTGETLGNIATYVLGNKIYNKPRNTVSDGAFNSVTLAYLQGTRSTSTRVDSTHRFIVYNATINGVSLPFALS